MSQNAKFNHQRRRTSFHILKEILADIIIKVKVKIDYGNKVSTSQGTRKASKNEKLLGA